MTASRTASLLLGASLLTLAACTDDPTTDPWPAGEFQLVAFDSCDQAVQELREAARAYMGPWGFGSGMFMDGGWGREEAAEGDAAAAPDAAMAPGAPQQAPAGPDHSGTNVHEAGVDEPDLVKTDGRRIVTMSGGVLRVVDAAQQTQTGTLDLNESTDDIVDEGYWQPADLLLHGDHALVLMEGSWWGGMPGPAEGVTTPAPVAGPRLLLVDLAGAPRVLSEYTIDGALVDARAVGQTVRVVVRSGPRLSYPELEEDASEAERRAANINAINEAGIESWLPRYEVTTGGQTDTGQVDCTALSHPEVYSGSSMLTVLTFDMATTALGDGAPVSVAADGDTVYSNGTSLYIASDMRWRIMPDVIGAPQQEDSRTEIYKFDTSQPGSPRYAGAGAVPGWLLNQYAMSEWEGHLRVATTSGETWAGDDTESAVYVLAERDGGLEQTGSVGGLGETEQIYAVRFNGPVGYVVTFRQTDPLYTLDLQDPAAPAVLGELEITGYSAYLHPLDGGRLIGVGQEATEEGFTQGTQVSLFDVSDLANPTRLAQHHVESGYSEAEYDPHAFLYWPAERLLVIPISTYDWSSDGDQPPSSGVLALRIEDTAITELGTITHPVEPSWDYSTLIRRALVIEDTLWTVSDQGLQASALSTLEQTAWIPFE
jgi:beta propeller domain-containing protein